MMSRADRHRNPAAITTDLAAQAGLVQGVDYAVGEPFPGNPRIHTARLLGDPVALTIRVIDRVGFVTAHGARRWNYAEFPDFAWAALSADVKRRVVSWMYQHEGGTEMRGLFS